MPNSTLSLKEKKRLNRCLTNVTRLSKRGQLSQIDIFIMRQQMRCALQLLGADYVSKVMLAKALDVLCSLSEAEVKLTKLKELIDHG